MVQTQLKYQHSTEIDVFASSPDFFKLSNGIFSSNVGRDSLCCKWFDDNNNNHNNNNVIFVKKCRIRTFLQGPIWHRLQLH